LSQRLAGANARGASVLLRRPILLSLGPLR
jgi:hypothetical protein